MEDWFFLRSKYVVNNLVNWDELSMMITNLSVFYIWSYSRTNIVRLMIDVTMHMNIMSSTYVYRRYRKRSIDKYSHYLLISYSYLFLLGKIYFWFCSTFEIIHGHVQRGKKFKLSKIYVPTQLRSNKMMHLVL